MRKVVLFILGIVVHSVQLFSQSSIEKVLAEIEKNNTTLSALRKSIEADKIGNKTEIYLPNPELEFAYLWGNPSAIGNRTDISFTQSFDFPTVYKFKNQISEFKNEQAGLEYQKQKKDLFFQSRLICNELIFQNAQKSELTKRLNHAENIANSINLKFEVGEANILENNKAKLNLLNARKDLELVEIERTKLFSELTRLNGGVQLDFNDYMFDLIEIPADFEAWYRIAEQQNPVLKWLKQEMEISQNRIKLNRAMNLPKLQTGYMSEKTSGEQFQGITIGLSIPLWENKNTVKFAEAKTNALQEMTYDKKLQFYNKLKILHTKAVGLQENLNDYRYELQHLNNTNLLKTALDKGEITLIEYILELTVYYESVNKLLEMEKELNDTFAELNQYI